MKVILWIGANIASIIGILQSIIKALKEIATAIINLISLILPKSSWVKTVEKVRDLFNTVDGWLEKLKGKVL